MGAMMRVDTDSTAPYLSVPADAREKIYDAVPELEPLAYWLEEDAQLQNDFRDPNLDDYRAGSFYWAIRRAAQFEGIYADAKTADAYWQTVADKINAACDAGTLPSRTGRRVATSQPISAAYVPSTLAETWNGFWHVLGLRDCAPYETLRSIGTEDDFAAWSGYLHCGFNSAANAGRTRPTTARTKRRFLPSCRAGRGSAVFCLRWACSAPCCARWQSFCRSGVKNARHRPLCRGCCCSASSALRCCAVP